MKEDIAVGIDVTLVSFNGTSSPDKGTKPSEDYWKLIGVPGVIVQDPNLKSLIKSMHGAKRVLVQFKTNIVALGLECHNPIDNALWINLNDLEKE